MIDLKEELTVIEERVAALFIQTAELRKELTTPKPIRKSARARHVDEAKFYIMADGVTNSTFGCSNARKQKYINNNNAFTTEESAMLEVRRNGLIVQLREVCNKHKPCDWNNFNQTKYRLGWNYKDNSYYITTSSYIQTSNIPHCTDQDALKRFAQSLSDADLKLLVCGVE